MLCKSINKLLPELPAALYLALSLAVGQLLPAALYLALSLAVGHHWCIFQSELILFTGLWIPESSRYLACQIFHKCLQRIGDSLRLRIWKFTRGVNLHWSYGSVRLRLSCHRFGSIRYHDASRWIDDALHPQFSILLHMYTILSINTSSQIY